MTPSKVLVTGAGRGIGKAIGEHFLDSGAAVTFHSREPGSRQEQSSARGANGPAASLLTKPSTERAGYEVGGDFTKEAEVEETVSEAARLMGGIDALIVNVGGLVARASIAEMTLEHWHHVMDVNLTSAFLSMKHALPHLSREETGTIVTISSLAGENGGGAGAAAYAASKAGLIGLTKSAAKEFAPYGVRVNSVAPGFISGTGFHEKFSPDTAQRSMIASTALSRSGTAEEVARTVVFLASRDSSFITGETIDVNGGQWYR